MASIPRRVARVSVRTQLLLAPVLVLGFMLVLGFISLNALREGQRLTAAAHREVGLVEVLRDSNSRQFESDRFQHLALRTTDPDEFKDDVTESTEVMGEAIEGFQQLAKQARTPELRREAAAQAKLLTTIGNERAKALELASHTLGQPNPAVDALVERLEGRIEGVDVANDKMVTAEEKVTEGIARAASEASKRGHRNVLLLLSFATLIGLLVSVVVARRLVGNVRRLRAAARGIAEGDIHQRVAITGGDELAETGVAFEGMIGYLGEMAAAGERIADGDLSADVRPRSEADVLGHAFSRMTASLRETIGGVAQTAIDVNHSSREVAETSQQTGSAVSEIAVSMSDVARGAGEQLELIAGARRSAHEVDVAVARTAELTALAGDVARGAHAIADAGMDAAERAGEAMGAVRGSSEEAAAAIAQLEAKSERIGSIVNAITEIAEQTNLLALNAAIEAARAGEHGRGFAVVADEVRRLAEDATGSAAEITALVAEIRAETRNTVRTVSTGAERTHASAATVEETGEALHRLRDAIDDIATRVEEIAAAAEVISSAAGQLDHDLANVAEVAERSSAASEQVSASTEQSSAASQQIAGSAVGLSRTADQLERMIARFTLDAVR